MTFQPEPGTLYLVGTPIGNRGDLSPRAKAVLEGVNVIAAEDTRETLNLLRAEGIDTPLVSHHAHNEAASAARLVGRLQQGEAIALVSDAGMPAISDPGERLVREVAEAGLPMTAVPGPTAFVTALALSGLPTARFVFEGFLPREAKLRRRRLRALQGETRTMIFYEAPHRLLDTLQDMAGLFGPTRPAAAARELTKRFEEVRRGSIGELESHFATSAPRGEFVLVVGGGEPAAAEAASAADWEAALSALLAEGVRPSEAARQIAQSHGVAKKVAYDAAQRLRT
ncbi:MAG: 16S rRNA (cytidine(1402)-2'-O)-methyltransferase [Candidatus Sericytochromatia bacterium]|nr:16S rRNA (cytidine(1402)-2'-O)-methyltransferase [Candidatus Sericytochromatia bacterium]